MAVLAAIGLGVQALSGIGSFFQAGQRQKEIDKANAAAQKAVAEAKKQIEVKPFEALTVSDTPYERQREMFASQAAQATQAAAEMGAAGMGRVGAIAMAGDEAQAKVRDQQIQQLEAIEQLKAQDEARASQQLASLSLQEAEGAQKAAADAQAAKAKSVTSGFTALSDATKIFTTIDPTTGKSVAESLGLGKGL
jgi:colicin import membrane protein